MAAGNWTFDESEIVAAAKQLGINAAARKAAFMTAARPQKWENDRRA